MKAAMISTVKPLTSEQKRKEGNKQRKESKGRMKRKRREGLTDTRPENLQIQHRIEGRDDAGRRVGQQRQTGHKGRHLLRGGVQQQVVGPAVDWKSANDFGVHQTEIIEHDCYEEQTKWSQLSERKK